MKEQTTLTLTNEELRLGKKIEDLLAKKWLIVTITPLHRLLNQDNSVVILFERDFNERF